MSEDTHTHTHQLIQEEHIHICFNVQRQLKEINIKCIPSDANGSLVRSLQLLFVHQKLKIWLKWPQVTHSGRWRRASYSLQGLTRFHLKRVKYFHKRVQFNLRLVVYLYELTEPAGVMIWLWVTLISTLKTHLDSWELSQLNYLAGCRSTALQDNQPKLLFSLAAAEWIHAWQNLQTRSDRWTYSTWGRGTTAVECAACFARREVRSREQRLTCCGHGCSDAVLRAKPPQTSRTQ